jgi:F0F1-type ATP synthase membrane subunit a
MPQQTEFLFMHCARDKSCQLALMQQVTCQIYIYLTHLRLQLHVQYQPGSDIFTCSFTLTPTTITTWSTTAMTMITTTTYSYARKSHHWPQTAPFGHMWAQMITVIWALSSFSFVSCLTNCISLSVRL